MPSPPVHIRRWLEDNAVLTELPDGGMDISMSARDDLVPVDVKEWVSKWSRGDGMSNGKVSANNASVQAQDNASEPVSDNAADERKARIASAETKVQRAKDHLEGAKDALRKAKDS